MIRYDATNHASQLVLLRPRQCPCSGHTGAVAFPDGLGVLHNSGYQIGQHQPRRAVSRSVINVTKSMKRLSLLGLIVVLGPTDHIGCQSHYRRKQANPSSRQQA